MIWALATGAAIVALFVLGPLAVVRDTVRTTYAPLAEVDSLVRQRYVEPVESDHLVDGAVSGVLRALDPYSGYISPEELPAYELQASGENVGVGIELGLREGNLVVLSPLEQSPAKAAGLRSGDLLLSIDGSDTRSLGVADGERLLQGEPGSEIELLVRTPGDPGVKAVTLTRVSLPVVSVRGFRPDAQGGWDYALVDEPQIAYIRISRFHERTAEQFDEALAAVRKLEPAGVVLDLRFNPGGSMRSAVQIADRFLASGVIVSTVTRHQAVDTYRAKAEGTVPGWPMAVIVNWATVSAAEILAGSLQSHDRAVIVGTRSFGKGVVQNVIPLESRKAAVSLTVAHYRLPDGRIIHRRPGADASDPWGIIPDVVVEMDEEAERAFCESRLAAEQSAPTGAGDTDGSDEGKGCLVADPQLSAAVKALQARIGGASAESDQGADS